ncbi:hypothetical protein OAU50_04740 [Planctomycetota bacterium]|nr:hypothetical protein [Planctomycetota bacterium]
MEETYLKTPEEYQLIEFFECEATTKNEQDGLWAYEVTLNGSHALVFSYDIHGKSVQTLISIDGKAVSTVSHEGAREMVIESDGLRCRFAKGTTLEIRKGDGYAVRWWSLFNSEE